MTYSPRRPRTFHPSALVRESRPGPLSPSVWGAFPSASQRVSGLKLAACIPNFVLHEYPTGEHQPPSSEIVKSAVRVENGFLFIPDAPGIGVELADDAQERHPPRARAHLSRRHVDGSVIDQ